MKMTIINKEFFLKIILPTLTVFSIFTFLIFAIIIPSIKNNMLDGKREMIRELTASAWSVLEEFKKEVSDSILTLQEAQAEAVKRIENMRYGDERKDYFWITDMNPRMIMHPYRSDLNNTDLTAYADRAGKRLFVESVQVVENIGEGYVDYMWQWKDDSTKIVPKLSFVKGFKEWDWIVGTGIYIEDVNEEISSITNNQIYISLGILIFLGFILFFISRQSLLIEGKRREAETGLLESEAKYRALVEASTDGLVMMIDGQFIYSNQAVLKMLGFTEQDLADPGLNEIITNPSYDHTSGTMYFEELASSGKSREQQPAQLRKNDGTVIDVILYTSKIVLGQKEGFAIIIKDVSTNKQIEEELDSSRQKYVTLANSIKIGVFRAELNSSSKIVEVNSSTARILGFEKSNELYDLSFFDFFLNKVDRKNFLKKLADQGSIEDYILQIRTKNGSALTVAISAVVVQIEADKTEYFDGTIDDITQRMKLEEERENLIVELQTSLRFLNQPISHFVKHMIVCGMQVPIHQVASQMTRDKYSAALIQASKNEYIGIITDQDLRRRVVAENYDLKRPIYEVMSSPLIYITSTALVFEALLMMNEKSTRHLAVKNHDGEIIGIISSEELITLQRHSTTYLLREIDNAESVDDLVSIRKKIPVLVKVLIDSGARSRNISRIITSVFEAISNKLISFAIKELGEPPVEFAFVALGSVGREEQTLISDQDNAIIYSNVPKEVEKSVHQYFHKLGTKVCDWLNDCGYDYCIGEAMAKNPKWCQSLVQWQEYFNTWITNSDQQDLIDLSIFFDFRCIYGQSKLTDQLRKYLFKVAEGQAGFFQHLTKNSLLHKPPVGLLGKIVVESKGEHQETFDIKAATMPISDFARIYALKNKVGNSNSLERLDGLLEKGVINKTTNEELQQAYNYLMQLRFKHQSEQIMEDKVADNYINPNQLTQIQQKTLKNIFTQILGIQKKLSYDFSGDAL